MIPKGLAAVTHTAAGGSERVPTTRRALLGATAVGAALALIVDRTAAASSGEPVSDADFELLTFVQSLELAARDRYAAAGAADPIFELLADQHEAYAQGIAAFTGESADTRDEALFSELESAFGARDRGEVATVGYELESAAVATHTELLTRLEDADAAAMVASMLAMEARHCVVLADLAGRGDDLDALLVNTAEPILPEGSS